MQYLFIVTHGRSGSTALMRVLNALPGYCIRGKPDRLRPLLDWLGEPMPPDMLQAALAPRLTHAQARKT
jgi:hypothetical protein